MAPSTKRQKIESLSAAADIIVTPDEKNCSFVIGGGVGVTSRPPAVSFSVSAKKDTPLLLAHTDILSHVLSYTNLRDVPAVALTSKKFSDTLKLIEETLWKSLVRKHHPIVERLSHELGTTSSNDWRSLFQRRTALLATIDDDITRSSHTSTRIPRPRPLSSYLFQCDLTLRRDDGRIGTTLSTLIEHVDLSCGTLELPFEDDIGAQLAAVAGTGFTTFDITVFIIDRQTGKQAVLYNGRPEHLWEIDWYYYGHYSRLETVPLLRHLPQLDTFTFGVLKKSGCVCSCDAAREEWSFFAAPTGPGGSSNDESSSSPSSSCRCCKCNDRWGCFYSYVFDLTIEVFDDFVAPGNLDDRWVLQFLQDGLVYK